MIASSYLLTGFQKVVATTLSQIAGKSLSRRFYKYEVEHLQSGMVVGQKLVLKDHIKSY